MNRDQIADMLGDVLHMLSTYERKGAIDGPLAIALYHGCESIIHKHIDASSNGRTPKSPN
tara:strand:- start:399 stop:578 length:180 start_codon:yes stop_codon:yes gene_type:complete